MNEEFKNIQKLAKYLSGKQLLDTEDLKGFTTDIVNAFAQYRSASQQINKDHEKVLNDAIKAINSEYDRIITELENTKLEAKSAVPEALAQLREDLVKFKEDVINLKPKDGEPGKDADEERIIEELKKAIPDLPEMPDMEAFEEKIEDKFKKVYEHIKRSVNGFPGVRVLSALMDVFISNPSNGEVLKYNSTSNKWENGTISAGANIIVKDEGSTLTSSLASLNFVGSGVTATNTGDDVTVTISTGSATPAGSDTQVQFNDGGSFGADAHFTYDKVNDILHVHKIAGDATDGLLIESANGTDIGILGAANTANATWYGTHNFPATGLQIGSSNPFTDSAGTLTLQNVDVLDATTETTIENALDTLPNVTSIQGRNVTLADAGANAIFGWDDTAGAYENLTASEATATLNAFVGDSGSGGTKGLVPAPSTGDSGKYLKGDGTWATIAGGDVTKVGTPVNNQIGVWTGDGTIEGDTALTFDTATDTLTVGSAAGIIQSGAALTVKSGSGYDVNVIATDSTTAGISGGNVNLLAGDGNTTGSGGDVAVVAGNGGDSGSAGNASLVAGNSGVSSSSAGGDVDVVGGYALGTGAGGVVDIRGGNASSNNNGGTVYVYGGAKNGTGVDGNVVLGNPGKVHIQKEGSAFVSILDANSITASRTFTFPDITGTFCINSTSQIHTVSSIELGHASDTSITRVSAGVAAIEGNNIITANRTASDTQTGVIEIATAAETTTGTDATRAVSPDGLAGSEFGKRTVGVLVSDPNGDAITTGDGKAVFPVDTTLNGMNLVAVKGYLSTVSSSGAPNVQIRRSRRSSATARTTADMLSTALTIDASEFESADAATAAVINTSNDDVQTGDMIFIDIDGAGTGAKGLQVLLTFQLP